MEPSIITALVAAIATIIIGAFTFRQQREKDSSDADVIMAQLKIDVEAALWTRVQSELATVVKGLEEERQKRKELEVKVKAQGVTILEHRQQIKALENENKLLRQENIRLRGE